MNELVRNSWPVLLVISLLGGTVSGALGVGSGILLIPALVIFMGMSQKVAQGTCLAVMVPMALMGAVRYYVNPEIRVNLGVIAVMIPLAVVGAYFGSWIAASLPAVVLRRAFGLFVVVVGVKMFFTS
jgi:uncharacterized membrane protein YfcA